MTDHPPLVSIVIPVYNGANFLGEAIESALAQNYENIEIIVVNDGSSDHGATEEIAKSYGKRIQYFFKENGGVASALNFGIKKMRGEYFSWLSHDDLYSKDKISSQIYSLKPLSGKNIVIPFGDIEQIDLNGKFIRSLCIDEIYLKSPILLILSTYMHGCSLLIPKKAFSKVGMFNESLKCVQDVEMWSRMAMAGIQFIHVPKILVQSRIHPEQTSWALKDRHSREKRDYNLWVLNFIDVETLLENHEEILKILFKKKQPAAIAHLLNILQTKIKQNRLHLLFIRLALSRLRLENYLIEKFPFVTKYIFLRKFLKNMKL